ncbi:MAG: GGDEF domain-containing phosphodiesterase, partial [Longicatena sp.]
MRDIQKNFANCSRTLKHDIAYIEEKYYEALCSNSKYNLIEVNIKNFRYYNAKHGYDGGNDIINEIYNVLLSFLFHKEYVAHIAADTFVMLLQFEDMHTFIYQRMFDLIEQAYRTKNEKIERNIFLSYGVYEMKDKKVGFYDAWNYACICRKESSGLATRCHSIEVHEQPIYNQYIHRMDLEIKTADAYKNYEFIAYLQPKIDLKTDKIYGAEALLRWIDEDGNFIPLSEFLPILNKNSYIELVDLDIFDQMCKVLDERIKMNKPIVPISFNISKTSFYTDNIVQKYRNIFKQYKIPKEYIEIELMESISLDDTEHMKKIVSEFKKYGFQCSLDDFGNGYSSFNVLLNA